MLTVYSDQHRLRDAQTELCGGQLVSPFECPKRAEIILERLKSNGHGEIIHPHAFGLEPVLAVHDEGFVSFLETCHDEWLAKGFQGEAIASTWPTRNMPSPHIPMHIEGRLGHYALAAETAITAGTWQAALAAKDVALTATAHNLNTSQPAFGLCRPPGHHAAVDQFGGYCFLNNAAIAAQFARDQGAHKVTILDVDFHHGNGTQNITYARDDIHFLSLHGDPHHAFPYFLGHADETGTGQGLGSNLNYPLPPETSYPVWRAALLDAMDHIAKSGADLLIVSLGVDTFKADPISFFKLESENFTDYGQLIAELGLPTVFLLEGGYAVEEIGINTVNVLDGFEQRRR